MLARRRWRSGYNAGGGPNHMGEQRNMVIVVMVIVMVVMVVVVVVRMKMMLNCSTTHLCI